MKCSYCLKVLQVSSEHFVFWKDVIAGQTNVCLDCFEKRFGKVDWSKFCKVDEKGRPIGIVNLFVTNNKGQLIKVSQMTYNDYCFYFFPQDFV